MEISRRRFIVSSAVSAVAWLLAMPPPDQVTIELPMTHSPGLRQIPDLVFED